MVLPSAAPESKYEHLEPAKEAMCAYCKRSSYLTEDGWDTEVCVDNDGVSDFLTGCGECLTEAADTPMGWVCSNYCRSQAMYAQAENWEKEALEKVLEACWILVEHGEAARAILSEKMEDEPSFEFIRGADDFIAIVGESGWK